MARLRRGCSYPRRSPFPWDSTELGHKSIVPAVPATEARAREVPHLTECMPAADIRASHQGRSAMSEAQPAFDPAKYKHSQHDQWNEDAAAWNHWSPNRERWFAGVTQRMLELAQLRSGQRV